MQKTEPFLADLHIHMGYADLINWGECSVEDVVDVAIKHNVRLIGIVDHYGGHGQDRMIEKLKEQIKQARKKFPEFDILLGMEVNVLTVDGEISIEPEIAHKLDFLLVGMHTIPAGGRCFSLEMKGKVPIDPSDLLFQSFLQELNWNDLIADWQKATLSLMNNPLISIYAHPVQWPFVVMRKFLPKGKSFINGIEDIIPPQIAQDIFSAAKKTNIAWEVNNDFLSGGKNSWSGLIDLFRIVEKFGVKVSLGTDAHMPDELERVGRLDHAIELLRLAEVSKGNIVLRKDQLRML